MIIKIDMRERDLITVMNDLIKNIPKYNNIKTEILNLELGDIIIYDESSNTNISIIERKTIKDLLSSIKDGRYDEQSYRLNGDPLPNHNIIYMIEGDVMNTRVKSSKGAGNGSERFMILSAICSLNYYKGFSVIKTQTITESAMYLCNMYMKIAKEMKTKKPYYIINATDTDKCTTLSGGGNAESKTETTTETSNDNDSNGETNNANNSDNDKDYVRVIKKNKKENITVDNINEIMLCQIPGISATTAIAIMAVHNTIHELIKNLEEDTECLKEIKTEDKNGKTRKLNSTVINNIKKFLLHV